MIARLPAVTPPITVPRTGRPERGGGGRALPGAGTEVGALVLLLSETNIFPTRGRPAVGSPVRTWLASGRAVAGSDVSALPTIGSCVAGVADSSVPTRDKAEVGSELI